LLLPLLLLSCSKKSPEAERRDHIRPSSSLPFSITVVAQTPETKERQQIEKQAAALLESRDFEKLDEYAQMYRDGEGCYADCSQKIALVYDGLEPSDEASNVVWEARIQKIRDWIDARPQSVTARIALARIMVAYAWNARSSEYADKVSDASWRLFFKRLNEAVAILNETKNLKQHCPVYWSTLMRAGLGLQVTKSQFNEVFKQAVKAEPDYKYYYHTRAVYLLPRWYGEAGEWEKDLAQSADKIGGEEGDMVYAQVVWGIHHYGNSIDVFDGNKISWERVDRGFAVILKQFPNSLAAKNERAHLAALASDKAKAQQYFLDTKGQIDLSMWRQKNEFIDAANWAFAQ
jgi:hypothetical protein